MSRRLDANRHLRFAIVFTSIALSLALALAYGRWDRAVYDANANLYIASAGLFIVALAIERLTELLIAPWVGGGDRRMDRNILVGSFALLLGVALTGLIGLRLLSLLSGDTNPETVGWLATSVDVFATGLAIGPVRSRCTTSSRRWKNERRRPRR